MEMRRNSRVVAEIRWPVEMVVVSVPLSNELKDMICIVVNHMAIESNVRPLCICALSHRILESPLAIPGSELRFSK